MKTFFSLVSVFVVITIITVIFATTSNAVSSTGAGGPAIPDSVTMILEKSCYPCHTSPGNKMAMSKLNFEKWDTYKPEKQASKAQSMCKEVTKGAMPTKSFRTNNPDKVPTPAEIKKICDWAASFPKEK